MKKIYFIIFILLLTGCNKVEEPTSINEVNLNDQVIEDKKINDLSTSDTSLIYDQGITTFKTNLKNNGDKIDIKNIKVKFENKNNTEIITLTNNINKTLDTNESILVTIISDIDLTDAYKIEYYIE